MAQAITPELEALLVEHLQVGPDKPRGELEIDYVIPGFTEIGSTQDLLLAYGTVTRDVARHTGEPNTFWGKTGGLPEFANDGSDTTKASINSGLFAYEDYLKADLGAAYECTALNVYITNGTMIDRYEYWDGAAWVELTGTWTGLASLTTGATLTFTAPVTAQLFALRARATGSHGSQELARWEILGAVTVEHEATHGTVSFQVESMSWDRSRKMVAAQLDVNIPNEDGTRGWYTGDGRVFIPNNPVRAYAWLGDRDNRVQVYTGLFDRIAEHRNPKTLALKARSRMKWMLEQGFVATAPQGADDEGAVRTEDNGVYLDKSPEYIAGRILDRAGWPSADRSIGTSGITLAEYVLADRSDWASQIAGSFRLTTATGWDFWEDELGIAHFEPSPLVASSEPTADWDFQAGVNVMALDHETDDEDRATRIEVSGPMTSAVPKWSEVWRTSILRYPAGIWYDPTASSYIKVIDRVTKYLYVIRQSDRGIAAKHYLGGYPLGLSGDPTDSSHFYVLNAPWRNTGSTSGNSLKEYDASTYTLLATHSLPDGRWTGMKTDGTNVFLTNYDDGKIYKRTMTGGAVGSDDTVYQGVTQTHPTGLWINGTTMGVFFSGSKRFLLMDTSDIGTVTGTQSTKGTILAGGEADTDTDIDLYGDADAGSFGLTSGIVAKFTLAELITKDVSALSIDYDLEDALGLQSGIADRDHGDCPNDPSPHAYEARLTEYEMEVVQSLSQAQDVADAQLALLSRLRRVLDLGTTGHPAVQLNDVIRYQDAPAGIDAKWIIDSYRASIGQTYTQTMSVLPWEAP